MTTTHIAILLAIVLLFGLLYRWIFKKRPPKKLPFSNDWRSILEKKVKYYQRLDASEKKRFEQSVARFLQRVSITGVEVEVDDTDRMLVAASAVIPLFGFPNWEYRNINEVLLYKTSFSHDHRTEGKDRHISGMVGEGRMNRLMILSKPALYLGFSQQAGPNNVGIHEFVHLLDKADGIIDGIPENLLSQQYTIPWIKMIREEMEEIVEGDSIIRPYGAANEAEFLSVVSEYFFNQPKKLERKHPELYELLERIFQQDPADL
ncbi:MAG: M90 family metallopeptidase [Bacteroidota bacterium]